MNYKDKIWGEILRAATLISPSINTKLSYYRVFKRWPNLVKPTTFNEKLLYLKLNNYNHNPIVVQCADKYSVRKYIEAKGLGDCLNGLIAVYDDVEDIRWNELPEKFAMKWNFGASYNIICSNKAELDIIRTKKILRKWGKKKYWLGTSEMQYKKCAKKIVCEKFLESDEGTLPEDYKLYCFNGKVLAILYIVGRGEKQKHGGFFSTDWNYLGVASKWYEDFSVLPKKPKSLDNMISIAEALADGFPFVRIDFYDIDGKAVFGEMTFTPGAGVVTAQIDIDGKSMGDLLQL